MAKRLTEAEIQARTDQRIARIKHEANLRACADELRRIAATVGKVPSSAIDAELDKVKARLPRAQMPEPKAKA